MIAVVASVLVAAASLGAGPHWPLHQQDPSSSRTVDTATAITVPGLRWHRRVGGTSPDSFRQDLNGDGQAEIVLLVGGRAIARDPATGTLLWSSPPLSLGSFMLDESRHARDMNGDGSPDIMVSKSRIGDTRVYALDGATGEILWVFGEGLGPTSGNNGGNRHWLGDVDLDGDNELVLYVPGNITGSQVYAMDFSGGFTGDVIQWSGAGHSHKLASRFAVADATGDGQLEVLLHAGEQLAVYSGASGALLSLTNDWHGPDHPVVYGVAPLPFQADIDDAQELLFTSPKPGGFVGVWTLGAGDYAPINRWNLSTSQSVFVAEPANVDGVGGSEVLVSRHDGEVWRTTAFGGDDGVPISFMDGWVLAGAVPRDAGGWTTRSAVADIDGDGRQEVAALLTGDDPPPALGSLNMLRIADDGVTLEEAWSVPLVTAAVAAIADLDGDGIDELICYRDLNGDGVRDALQIVDGSGVAAKIRASLPFGKAEGRTLLAVVGTELLTFATDGFIDTYDAELSPIGSRVPTGGHAPRVLALPRTAGGDVEVLVKESAGRVVSLGGGLGTPAAPPPGTTLFDADEERDLLAAVDVDGDGDVEVLTRHVSDGEQVYSLTDAGGATIWSEVLPGATTALSAPVGTGGDLDGDDVIDFYLQTSFGGVLRGLPLSGATGLELGWAWEPYQVGGGAGTVYSSALLHDFDSDGLSDVLVGRYNDRVAGSGGGEDDELASLHLLRGTDGAVLAASNPTNQPPRMMASPLPTGEFRVLYSVWSGRGAFVAGGAPPAVAQTFLQAGGHAQPGYPMALDVNGDGIDDLIDHDTFSGGLTATDATNGDTIWSRVLSGGALHADAASAGTATPMPLGAVLLRGQDGAHTVVLGDNDGRVYGVDPIGPALRWVHDLGFAIGSLAASDLDGDGTAELLVSVGDGYLYAIGQAADVGVVSEVRDGTGADVDLVEDVDQGIDPGRFSASWEPPTGGTEAVAGYLVRLVTDTGALVVDWVDAADATSVTVTAGVSLVAGVTYRVMVLPYGPSASGAAALSDGFELVAGLVAEPAPGEDTAPTADDPVAGGTDGGSTPADTVHAPEVGPTPDGGTTGGDTSTEAGGGDPGGAGGCDCAAGGHSDPSPVIALMLLALMLRRRTDLRTGPARR